ncbi:MAG: hypothetical protein JSU06_20260 [Actinobacteria bacterium]|nr:hypothetical protein [Actinomycetota bacterium]
MWRWLRADPRESVDLAGAGALAAGPGEAELGAELRRWRGIVARRRLLVLARRHAAVALGLAAVLEVLAQLGEIPQWIVVAVSLVAFLVAVTVLALRGPSPFGLARLLDEKLGLNDRLATALEIEARGGGVTPLERRTVADAAALLAAGRQDWHASAAAPAGREWWALAGSVAAVAVVVAIGTAAGGGSSAGPAVALGPAGGGHGKGGAQGEGVKRAHDPSIGKAPTGKLHKFETAKSAPPSAEQTSASGYQKIPQGERTAGRERKGRAGKGANGEGSEARSGKKLKRGANSELKGGEEGGKKAGASLPKEKEHPTLGFNVKSKGGGEHGRRGPSKVSGAAAKKPAPNGAGDEATAGESKSEKKGGSPAGTNHAGGESGNNRQGHATPITGQASQAVRIQPAYAPSRSTKAGKERKKGGNEQGQGGKARTARVTGATQVGSRFSFVPVTGGAVLGPSTGLQLNYLEALKWVERLSW